MGFSGFAARLGLQHFCCRWCWKIKSNQGTPESLENLVREATQLEDIVSEAAGFLGGIK